jgi:predicted DNA-binding transcriptional regulator AlpA
MAIYLGYALGKRAPVISGFFDTLKIESKPAVLQRIGLSRSTLHRKIQKGLWCPPINLDTHAVGFLEHETEELIAVHSNGYSSEKLRELVKNLDFERALLLGAES